MSSTPSRRARGFTLIELIVVVALVAIMAALAAPSFTKFLAKKRVEGVMSELVTDLQYARSEAVQRNTIVQITIGTGCYVIYALASTATTTASGASCSQSESVASVVPAGASEIKTAKLLGNVASITTESLLTDLAFDPVRGTALFAPSSLTTGSINVVSTSSSGSWQLRAVVMQVGRVQTCVPTGSSMAGYSTCS